MPPIRLTDAELAAVMDASRPIPVNRRDQFLQQVASSLQSCREIGPGVVYRVAAETQGQFFDPPQFERAAGTSKYR